jgi:hypothetical protein
MTESVPKTQVMPTTLYSLYSSPTGFDHEQFAIYVWRSVRASGDTKTEKSRRTLELPTQAAEALRTHHVWQVREWLWWQARAGGIMVLSSPARWGHRWMHPTFAGLSK